MGGPAFYTGTINVAKNDDWVQPFVMADGSSAPINLTGSGLAMQIRTKESDNTALVSLSVGNGITITDPTNGAFTIALLIAGMVNLTPGGSYVADLVRTLPDGTHERIFDVAVTVAQGTTR